jgi:uncharacterized membrane protein YbjE (DUF340 family)
MLWMDMNSLELYTGVGISVGIGWYFVGIIPTNTNGKLGW